MNFLKDNIYPLFVTTKRTKLIISITTVMLLFVLIIIYFFGLKDVDFRDNIYIIIVLSIIVSSLIYYSIKILAWFAKAKVFPNIKYIWFLFAFNIIYHVSIFSLLIIYLISLNNGNPFIEGQLLFGILFVVIIIIVLIQCIFNAFYIGINDTSFFIGYFVFKYNEIEDITVIKDNTLIPTYSKIKISTKAKKDYITIIKDKHLTIIQNNLLCSKNIS